MADHGVKGRVKGLLGGPPAPNEQGEQPVQQPEPNVQQQAFHVLDLAQRTADDYVAGARRESEQICAEARAKAEQIVRDAQARAQARHREAEKLLSDAQAKADQVARDVQAYVDKLRREAEGVLSEAHGQAKEIAKTAQVDADEHQRLAKQRYDEVVGSLAAKREALQSQIEALEGFEREYRNRLTAFMQSQIRALWVGEPQVEAEPIEQPISPPSEPAAAS